MNTDIWEIQIQIFTKEKYFKYGSLKIPIFTQLLPYNKITWHRRKMPIIKKRVLEAKIIDVNLSICQLLDVSDIEIFLYNKSLMC